MCRYKDLSNGKCGISGEICPYLYFCSKIQQYKESQRMPKICKVMERYEAPKGAYKVAYEKRGALYVEVNDTIVIVDNPYDYTPSYVKMNVKEGDWKVEVSEVT